MLYQQATRANIIILVVLLKVSNQNTAVHVDIVSAANTQ